MRCFFDNSTLKLYIFLSIDDSLIWYVCIEGNLLFGLILRTISPLFILYIFLYSLERERGWYDMFILRMEQKQVQCKSELLSAWNRVFHFTSFLDNGCYIKQGQTVHITATERKRQRGNQAHGYPYTDIETKKHTQKKR